MKKRLLAMLMAGVVAVSVCACGSKAEDAANTTDEAVTEEATTQEIDEIKVSEREDYVPLEDMETDDFVSLPEYASMTVQAVKPEVTDEKIESYINGNILAICPVTDRAVESGDAVLIDYVGKRDGVAFEGGTDQGVTLNIGSGLFIPGFEEGLIGVMPGETIDLNLTFPLEYHAPELAGAEVVFTVTVHEIQESAEYASVTQEQLNILGYDSKEAVWEQATKTLEESAQASYENNIANAIMEKLWNESSITSAPEHLVDEEVQNIKIFYDNLYMMNYGMNLEAALTSQGMVMEDFYADVRPACEETVKLYLIMESIARAEGIEITDEMIYEEATQDALLNGNASADEFIELVGKSTIRNSILSDMVMEKLKDKVSVETITEEEAMAEAAAAAATEVAE